MNENKICFISCVNDHQLYKESLYYINQLEIPEGFEIECICVEDAISMTQGYNKAMKESDAKYKVYLHQDVYIINKSFIRDVLDVFNSNDEIGMLGMAGAKTIPTNGVWLESTHKYGEVYENHTGKMELLQFNEVTNNYEEVKVIDGLIMITQYDISWREDVFDGWHFYDVSQSVEFTFKGYKIVIPKQEEIWCIHDCGILNVKNGYEHYRSIFLEEYSKFIYPLVSILIPTYNRPKYLQLALESVLNQTYRNIEVIIGDDGTNNETEKLIGENFLNKYDNIKYYHNEKNLGQFDNDIKLYDMANGKYINYLMDDDLFEVTKIQKMMNYFIQDENEEISLVTSHRSIIDTDGNIGEVFGNTNDLFNDNIVIDGIKLVDFMIKTNFNCIGEPTTVLFRKSKLKEPFGVFNNRRYGCNVDQATWFNLLSLGKAVFINEVLSYFRIHDSQQLASDKMKLLGALDYAHEVLTAREKDFLRNDEDFRKALSLSLKYCKSVNEYFDKIMKKKEFKKEINELKEMCEMLVKNSNELIDKKGINNVEITNELPLVSILIPAYNQTKYLKEALESAINQTYPNIEIIIGDDSSTDEVEIFIKPYVERYRNISYYKNERDSMDYGISNTQELLRKSKGEYINYLYHDDVFEATKIEKMMKYYLNSNDVTLVTSHRQLIDENGNFIADSGATQRLFNEDKLLDGIELGRCCLNSIINYIGEATTVLLKKSLILNELFKFNNNIYLNIGDLAMWLSLLNKGRAVYISESLSYFRRHSSQNTFKPEIFLLGVIEWKKIIYDSYEIGFIYNYEEYKSLILKWFNTFNYLLKEQNIRNVDIELEAKLKQAFSEAIAISNDNYNIYQFIDENYYEFYNLFENKKYKESLSYINNIYKESFSRINKDLVIEAKMYKVDTVRNYCSTNGLKYVVVEEERERDVFIPHYYNDIDNEKVVKETSPEVYITELKNINIIGENSVIISNDYCLYDIAKKDNSTKFDLKFNSLLNIDENYAILNKIDSDMIIEKAICLVGFSCNNYYHFTVEILSRLQYIDSFVEYRTLPIIVDEVVKTIPQYSELLNKINKYNHRIIYIKKNYMYKVRELIYPSYNTWMPINVKPGIKLTTKEQLISKSAINYIRSNVLKEERDNGFRKIFISRKNTANSRLINEENVINLFKLYGFEIVYPEELNFEEQVRIFSEAEYVAGASGAAFTNILYCPSNAKIICIVPKEYNFYIYSTISKLIRLQCIFLEAKIITKAQTISNEKFECDLNYCEKCLRNLKLCEK